jgi:hypothetical protein
VSAAVKRVKALIAGAKRLADPSDPLGQRVRRELTGVTGLSAQGVEWALTQCLETSPSDAEIATLIERSGEAKRAHVLLSANVFVASHRAIAIGLAASDEVFVRASRREPVFAQLLSEAAPGLFTLVPELKPQPGDLMWAYGSDQTLVEIKAQLLQGVQIHAQGSGFGVVAVREEDFSDADWAPFADAVALDTVLFDQRGCLSPRLVVAQGSSELAARLQQELLAALDRIEATIPRGQMLPEERADVTWYRECVRSLGDWSETATAAVARVEERTEPIPPPGRNLQICRVPEVTTALTEIAPQLTCIAHHPAATAPWKSALFDAAPHARHCPAGQMQRPPFDGPADLR